MTVTTTTKADLAQRVAAEIDCPRVLALQVVDALFTAMRRRLLAGDRIAIRSFGTLCVKQARARPRARNPKTGQTVRVPARRKVQFKPGQALREGLHRPPPKA